VVKVQHFDDTLERCITQMPSTIITCDDNMSRVTLRLFLSKNAIVTCTPKVVEPPPL
jgi:hypothetical protein